MDVSQRGEMAQGMTTGVTHSSGSFELIAGAALFALFGWALDGAFGTTPLFILIGAAFGFCISSVSVYLQYRRRMDNATAERTARSTGISGAGSAATS